MAARTVIVGVGNPVLTDDGVGIAVVRELAPVVAGEDFVAVVERSAGGLALMEALIGYERAILVDAMVRGGPPGTIYRTCLENLRETLHSTCAHDLTLSAAMSLGRFLGLALPAEIDIWGIEPAAVDMFSERLSPEVAAALPAVVREIGAAVGLGWRTPRAARIARGRRARPA